MTPPHCLWCRASCYFNPCTSICMQSCGREAVADIQSYLFFFSKLLVLELSLTSGKNEVSLLWAPPVLSLPSTPNSYCAYLSFLEPQIEAGPLMMLELTQSVLREFSLGFPAFKNHHSFQGVPQAGRFRDSIANSLHPLIRPWNVTG